MKHFTIFKFIVFVVQPTTYQPCIPQQQAAVFKENSNKLCSAANSRQSWLPTSKQRRVNIQPKFIRWPETRPQINEPYVHDISQETYIVNQWL